MQETWAQSLGHEDPLEKEMATHSSILAWNPMDRGAWQATVHEVAKSRAWQWLIHIEVKIDEGLLQGEYWQEQKNMQGASPFSLSSFPLALPIGRG